MSVVIRGVHITNYLEEKSSALMGTILKPLLSKQNSLSQEGMEDMASGVRDLQMSLAQKKLDFRDKKLPHSLIMFAQVKKSNLSIYSNTIRVIHQPMGLRY